MKRKVASTVEVIEHKTSAKATSLIEKMKAGWSQNAKNIVAIAQWAYELEEETEAYRENDELGMTYTQAVALTGIPRSTVKLYRDIAEFCHDHQFDLTRFFALYDSGVNISADRYKAALSRKDVKTFNASDGKAVADLIKELKKEFPAPAATDLKATVVAFNRYTKGLDSPLARDPKVKASVEKARSNKGQAIRQHLEEVEVLLEAKLEEVREVIEENTDIPESLLNFIAAISGVLEGESTEKVTAKPKPSRKLSKAASKKVPAAKAAKATGTEAAIA